MNFQAQNLDDVMIFNDQGQPVSWTVTATLASVLNHNVFYRYDTDLPHESKTVPKEAILREDDTRNLRSRFSLSPEDKVSS